VKKVRWTHLLGAESCLFPGGVVARDNTIQSSLNLFVLEPAGSFAVMSLRLKIAGRHVLLHRPYMSVVKVVFGRFFCKTAARFALRQCVFAFQPPCAVFRSTRASVSFILPNPLSTLPCFFFLALIAQPPLLQLHFFHLGGIPDWL
jgi:hypothetical protein